MAVAEPTFAIPPTTLTPAKGEWLRLPHPPVSAWISRSVGFSAAASVRIRTLCASNGSSGDLRKGQHFGPSVVAEADGAAIVSV
jgi:hypothetical protein